jgi:hypothetical protein
LKTDFAYSSRRNSYVARKTAHSMIAPQYDLYKKHAIAFRQPRFRGVQAISGCAPLQQYGGPQLALALTQG